MFLILVILVKVCIFLCNRLGIHIMVLEVMFLPYQVSKFSVKQKSMNNSCLSSNGSSLFQRNWSVLSFFHLVFFSPHFEPLKTLGKPACIIPNGHTT